MSYATPPPSPGVVPEDADAELDSVRPNRVRHCSCHTGGRMKVVRRDSVNDDFEIKSDNPIPDLPPGGARVKIYYAGVCYTDLQMRNTNKRHPQLKGMLDTSLFPGYEVAGIVDEVCNSVLESCLFAPGDRVVVYPETEDISDVGYAEFITVRHVSRCLVKIPDTLPLEIASQLPCGALKAFSAVKRAVPFVNEKRELRPPANVLIVGAGGLSLWTLKLAEHYLGDDSSRVHITVADTNLSKLALAKGSGCHDIIHWSDEIYEEHLLERTRDVCNGGVDVIIDFVSSPRTIRRSVKVLREEGVLIVGGNTWHKAPISLHALASRHLSILGIKNGSLEQLQELVNLLGRGAISAPEYKVFPVDQASAVFEMLNDSAIHGRAILAVCPEETDAQVTADT